MPQCVNPGCRRETGDRLVCLSCGTPVPPNAAEPLLEAAGDASRRYAIPVFDAATGLGRKLTVGRMPGSDIHLSGDDQISRRHATLWSSPGGRLTIEDRASKNGTWVDGARLSEPDCPGTARLWHASTISFGDPARNVFRVVVPTTQSGPDPPPGPEAEAALPADASLTGQVDPAATLPVGENLTGLLIFLRRTLAGRVEPEREATIFGGAEAQRRGNGPAGRQVGLPVAGLPADAWRIARAPDGRVRLTVRDAQVRLSVNSTPVNGHADLRDGDSIKLAGAGALELIYCDPPARRVRSLLDLDLEEGCEVTVGRAPECHARLAHPTVSRQHASLCLRSGKVLVRSLTAANPARVDGRAVPPGQTADAGARRRGRFRRFALPVRRAAAGLRGRADPRTST